MNITDAIKEIKKATVTFRALEKMDEVANLLANAEGMAFEIVKKNEKAQAELDAKLAESTKIDTFISEAKAQADNIIDEAGKKAFKITEDANAYAADLATKSYAKHEDSNKILAEKEAESKLLDVKIEKAKAELDGIVQAIETAKSKLKGFIG
jgi:hypothetical protein